MSRERDALELFTGITDDGKYANLALKDVQGDPAFICALIYTTLEHMSYIDYVLSHYAKGKKNRYIRNILRLGTAQILYMNRPDSAVCNECVKLTREIGKGALSGYVNGVLRTVCREKDNLPDLPQEATERIAILTGYPVWLVREYVDKLGEDGAEAALMYSGNTVCIRPQYPYAADDLIRYLDAEGIEYRRGKLDNNAFHVKAAHITESELFTQGRITVQSESSCIVCRLCGEVHGMKILDACAAPGGKSAYIYSLANGDCDVTACEVHEHRCALTEKTFSRLGVEAGCICRDMTKRHEDFVDKFDIVLCDVPCSGLGVLGKPDARYRRDIDDIEAIADLQYKILSSCAQYVKRGGRLVYSTCTVSGRENEAIVGRFLSEHTDYRADTDLYKYLPESLRDRAEDGAIRLYPHMDGTDAFFAAGFIRGDA